MKIVQPGASAAEPDVKRRPDPIAPDFLEIVQEKVSQQPFQH